MQVTSENFFDAARGLYWFCNDWHDGQNSELYSIMSARLEYTPGMSESAPTADDETDEDYEAYSFYEALVAKQLDPSELCQAILTAQDEART